MHYWMSRQCGKLSPIWNYKAMKDRGLKVAGICYMHCLGFYWYLYRVYCWQARGSNATEVQVTTIDTHKHTCYKTKNHGEVSRTLQNLLSKTLEFTIYNKSYPYLNHIVTISTSVSVLSTLLLTLLNCVLSLHIDHGACRRLHGQDLCSKYRQAFPMSNSTLVWLFHC